MKVYTTPSSDTFQLSQAPACKFPSLSFVIKVSNTCLGYTKSFPDRVGSIVFGSSPALMNNSLGFLFLDDEHDIANIIINVIEISSIFLNIVFSLKYIISYHNTIIIYIMQLFFTNNSNLFLIKNQ